MYVSNIVTSLLNAHRVLKISKTKSNIDRWVIKPLLSVISAYTTCQIISKYIIIPNIVINMIFKIGIICGMYIFMLFLFGIIEKDSLKFLKRIKFNSAKNEAQKRTSQVCKE